MNKLISIKIYYFNKSLMYSIDDELGDKLLNMTFNC
jgi:hypothetical protein